MGAKEIKKRFSDKDIRNQLWARTVDGAILRLIGVGRQYIRLMHGNGVIQVTTWVVGVAPDASDLPK